MGNLLDRRPLQAEHSPTTAPFCLRSMLLQRSEGPALNSGNPMTWMQSPHMFDMAWTWPNDTAHTDLLNVANPLRLLPLESLTHDFSPDAYHSYHWGAFANVMPRRPPQYHRRHVPEFLWDPRPLIWGNPHENQVNLTGRALAAQGKIEGAPAPRVHDFTEHQFEKQTNAVSGVGPRHRGLPPHEDPMRFYRELNQGALGDPPALIDEYHKVFAALLPADFHYGRDAAQAPSIVH